MFSEKDIKHIHSKGISIDNVHKQIKHIKQGMSYSNLVSAARVGKGIKSFSNEETSHYVNLYKSKQNSLDIVKFVPASGAATRMFKFLFQFLKNFDSQKESIESYIERLNDKLVKTFISNLKRFPFYDDVITKVKLLNPKYDTLDTTDKYVMFVKTMLEEEEGLSYSFFPKGLLPFHKYNDGYITAFQEHLFESFLYALSNNQAHLHFTVSEKHHNYFLEELNRATSILEKDLDINFNVTFSYQKENTQTVALTVDNEVFRNEDGSILFRPAGHGALIENLNELDFDLIFIKNIDNITVSNKNTEISKYKQLLAGVLVETQEKVFNYLRQIDEGNITESDLDDIILFLNEKLNISPSIEFNFFELDLKIHYIKNKLNRPIRVCGMVKNEGQPGGGPFWVKGEDGNLTLQIVEFAQINFSRQDQQSIVYSATHFNPTDLVCGVRDYKGEKFDLTKYIDSKAAFVTKKTQNGTDIKALELPGLWNGSMACWNSIFVEVPLETFNPVKTVNDLLNTAHQV